MLLSTLPQLQICAQTSIRGMYYVLVETPNVAACIHIGGHCRGVATGIVEVTVERDGFFGPGLLVLNCLVANYGVEVCYTFPLQGFYLLVLNCLVRWHGSVLHISTAGILSACFELFGPWKCATHFHCRDSICLFGPDK